MLHQLNMKVDAHLTWSGPCEESSWGSTASLSDASVTQPINKLFTQESHMICRKNCVKTSPSHEHNLIKQRMLIYMHAELFDHWQAVYGIWTFNFIFAWNLLESLPCDQPVTFSEALRAVCEDIVEEGQGVCERVSWPLWLSVFETAKQLSAERRQISAGSSLLGFAVCKRWGLGHECRTENKTNSFMCSYVTVC